MVVADPVLAEVLSGALDEKTYRQMQSHFSALRRLDPPVDLWSKIARSRFELARKGIQASLIDLILAWTAVHHNCHVLTLDADFQRLAPIVPVPLFSTEKA